MTSDQLGALRLIYRDQAKKEESALNIEFTKLLLDQLKVNHGAVLGPLLHKLMLCYLHFVDYLMANDF